MRYFWNAIKIAAAFYSYRAQPQAPCLLLLYTVTTFNPLV